MEAETIQKTREIPKIHKSRGNFINCLIVALLAVSVAFVSCEKNNNRETGPALVSRMIISGTTVVYSYDAQNRITSVNINGTTYTITYPSANAIRIVSGGKEDAITLNNDGLITNFLSSYGYEYVWEYENGYLKKMCELGGYAWVNEYSWVNGCLKSELMTEGAQLGRSAYYSYSSIPDKQTNISLWSPPCNNELGVLIPASCFGKSSPYLLSEEEINPGETAKYRYETDTKGYVTNVYREVNGDESLWLEIQYK
jgi:hypothetical protein